MHPQAIAASLAASAPAPAPASTAAPAPRPESAAPSVDHELQPRKAFGTEDGSEPSSISAPAAASKEQVQYGKATFLTTPLLEEGGGGGQSDLKGRWF